MPRELLWAIMFCLAVAVAGLFHALKQHPPYAPEINSQQQADRSLKGSKNTDNGAQHAAAANKEDGGKHGEQGENEGTEFWPTFLGYRLKITDTLLAAFTFGLLIFTGLLWKSTDKLWAAGERQAHFNRESLIADQRAWIITALSIDEDFVFTKGHMVVGVKVKITNIGKTAAVRAHTNIKLIADGYDAQSSKAVSEFAKECAVRDTENSRVVLPSETYYRPWAPHVDRSTIGRVSTGGSLLPTVIGCVTYEILQDDAIHQSAFAYHLTIGKDGKFNGLIPLMDVGKIPHAEILPEVTAGGFAT